MGLELLRVKMHLAEGGAVASRGSRSALGRLGQPQDIADMVALLAGEDARWITGQDIRANDRLI
jgi:3-oxoacyl-[acyl-carrier protein] reductase